MGANLQIAGVAPCPSSPQRVPPVTHLCCCHLYCAHRALCNSLAHRQPTAREVRGRRWDLAEREEHIARGRSTLLGSTQLPEAEISAPAVSIAPGDVRPRAAVSVRVLHGHVTALSSHIPAPPASCESRALCGTPSHFLTQQASYRAEPTREMLRQCPVHRHHLFTGLFHTLLPSHPPGTLGHTCSTSTSVSIQ